MLQVVKREELIKQLVSVIPGVSGQDILEQSSCFVFLDGRVITFNGDVACWNTCCLKKFRGVVQAKILLEILKARPEETLNLSVEDKKLIIRGNGSNNRISRITMESEITLPFKEVREPKEWNALPPDFLEAIESVHRCCGNDQDHLETFIHITSKCVEAVGEHQVGHFRTELLLEKDVVVHKDSIKHIVPLGMTEYGLTRKWMHFRNAGGVVLSCLRWPGEEDYPNTAKVLSTPKGKRFDLPRSLYKAILRASIFSKENPEDTDIQISLKANKIRCKGMGTLGEHLESHKVQYNGPDILFTISPALLSDLCHRHNEAWITSNTLTVKTGKFTFVTALGVEDTSAKKEDRPAKEDKDTEE